MVQVTVSICNILLTDWFARKNVDNTVIFVTIFIIGTNQIRLITNNIIPLQSGYIFYERAKLTGAQYKHRYRNHLNARHVYNNVQSICLLT